MEGTDQTVSIYRSGKKIFLIKKRLKAILGFKEVAAKSAKEAQEEAFFMLA